MRFSFGFDVDKRVRQAILSIPESAWVKAIRPDAKKRKHSQVCEITDQLDISSWPSGSRLIARRTKLKEGDQQSFADHDGYRLAVFITDQKDKNIAKLDLIHRGHARVEDRIREAKDCGLRNLPFRSFAHNQVWLWLVMLAQDLIAWTKQLCLTEEHRAWELKKLRYRLLHQSGRIARHARQTILRLAQSCPGQSNWPGRSPDSRRSPRQPAERRRHPQSALTTITTLGKTAGVSLPKNNPQTTHPPWEHRENTSTRITTPPRTPYPSAATGQTPKRIPQTVRSRVTARSR